MGEACGESDDQGQESEGGNSDDEQGAAREVAPRPIGEVRPGKCSWVFLRVDGSGHGFVTRQRSGVCI